MRTYPGICSSIGLAIALGAQPGCVESTDLICDGGWLCPSHLACGNDDQRCVPADRLEACEGKPQQDPCFADDAPVGVCRDGICTQVECGNAHVDPDEACDDGNTESEDGCRMDCRSDELCGNGVLDPHLGEACDDANSMSHDGCDSRCAPELPVWSRLIQLPAVPTVAGAITAYDDIRGQLIVFGGGIATNTTREWDGRAWIELDVRDRPRVRQASAMTYDAARYRVVMFGGLTGSTLLGDTWLWDGRRWSEHVGAAPAARSGHLMVDDRARQRVVLFGGIGTTTGELLDDMWEWDGTTWTQIQGVTLPTSFRSATAAYDPVRRAVVVYGPDAETWLWDGATWSMAGIGPGLRVNGTMSFSPALDAIVFAGGTPQTDAIWLWNGTTWSIDAATTPPSHVPRASFYDPARAATVILGSGLTGSEMWASTAPASLAQWTPIVPERPPSLRAGARLAYDSARARVVMFGGFGEGQATSVLNDTWELGARWQRRATASSPPPTFSHIMAHDERRRVTVLIEPSNNHVYEWDGSIWKDIAPPSAGTWPEPRTSSAIAYDRARGVIVMFGGRRIGQDLSDTWLWDGTSWQAVDGTVTPPPRNGHQLAYDARRQAIVMVGGNEADTGVWEWDGSWKQVLVTGEQPGPRTSPGMTYDPVLGEIVIYGGANPSGTALVDTWLWNGARWKRIPVTGGPAVAGGALVYHSALAASVVLTEATTWMLRWQSSATDDLCDAALDLDGDGLAGCSEPDCWFSCTPTCPPGTSCPS